MNEPAFPQTDTNSFTHYTGITIRDYFAAASLTGMLSHEDNSSCDPRSVALNAYGFADAMLEARKVLNT